MGKNLSQLRLNSTEQMFYKRSNIRSTLSMNIRKLHMLDEILIRRFFGRSDSSKCEALLRPLCPITDCRTSCGRKWMLWDWNVWWYWQSIRRRPTWIVCSSYCWVCRCPCGWKEQYRSRPLLGLNSRDWQRSCSLPCAGSAGSRQSWSPENNL